MALLYAVVSGVILTAVVLITVFILRLFGILRHGSEYKPGQKGSVSVLVVAGSGGHTTEIIRLLGSLSQSYNPRHYVIADTDKMSEEKIRTFEAERKKSDSASQFTLHWIPRSREVRQSWSSSVLSSLSALMSSVPLVLRLQPDMQTLTDLCTQSSSPSELKSASLNWVRVISSPKVDHRCV
ncbi:UDP-N-acetylglucosamine transferase subunit ALG14 isoform X2 [Siphateles boraxobius]|uniref:UDP-N-acetylglucosamine transferase subunit ALG14 isoform X2 n=1 Tax=Siphateles boraxobius TaxID=180520 RepID=UPI004062A4A9